MLSDILEESHRRVDRHLQNYLESLREGKAEPSEFEKAKNSLHNHIFWEESVLFRVIENGSNSARIHGLEVEHGGIWKLLDKIEGYAKTGEDELAIDRTEGLIRVLSTHNQAEERTVYGELEQQDINKQAEMILFEIEHAQPPEGWMCSILRRRR